MYDMKKNENEINKIQFTHNDQEYIILNKCPHCNLEMHPTVDDSYSFTNNQLNIVAISLSCPSCKKGYFIFNDFGESVPLKDRYLLSIPTFNLNGSSLVQNTSTNFQNLFSQSVNCELQGFYDIAFFGYIKSLDILIKDIAILEHPESEDSILFSSLISCLEKYHSTNIHLFSNKLLDVLKNEYLHYHTSSDIQTYIELVKDCIDYFLLYLELLLKTFSLNSNKKP